MSHHYYLSPPVLLLLRPSDLPTLPPPDPNFSHPHAPHPKVLHNKEDEKATAFRGTNASAFAYADLSLSALIVDAAVAVAG